MATADTVQRIFQAITQRDADPGEVLTFLDDDFSEADVAAAIASSAAALAEPSTTIRVYEAVFGRKPDAGGFNYWVDRLNDEPGFTVQSLATQFVASPEFTERFGVNGLDPNFDRATLVQSLYENVLGRAPEPAGLAFWLNTTFTPAQLVVFFSQSPEFIARAAPEIQEFFIDIALSGDLDPEGGDENDFEGSIFDEDNAGQNPDDGGAGGGPAPTFTVFVDEDDQLTFGGTASGDITVNVTEDGRLSFTRSGVTAELDEDGPQTFKSIMDLDGAELLSANSSDVLAYLPVKPEESVPDGDEIVLEINEEPSVTYEWQFVGNGRVDVLDAYKAIGDASNVLFLSGFDASDISYLVDPALIPLDVLVLAQNVGSGNLRPLLEYFGTFGDVSMVAADGSNTSLNGLIQQVADLLGFGGFENFLSDYNIGLPVANASSFANESEVGRKSAVANDVEINGNSATGFTLIGAPDDAANERLIGGDGDDNLIGLADRGTLTLNLYPEAGGSLTLPGGGTGAPSIVFDGRLDTDGTTGPTEADGIAMRLVVRSDLSSVTLRNSTTGQELLSGPLDGGQTIYFNVSNTSVGFNDVFSLSYTIEGGASGSRTGTAGVITESTTDLNVKKLFDPAAAGFGNPTNVLAGDVLTGGAGADTFVYLEGSGVDFITDFDETEDRLIILGSEWRTLEKDIDGDTEVDTLIYFVDEGVAVQNAGIVLLGVTGYGLAEG